ncbi:hypothetical protein [Sphingobacterium psychroaquaticum]|uniref:Uncharacterized protein n=1 Tax=Sphingobacterium psychroaquaticum TaxID=561061 RepID=A0A1X7IMH9_9SPHI|nr:hypothetical protein [Sphingobacterium psychroaquaticum]SMG15564.1 hypothetical protein SAMN05660862_0969 [Sphingobacterium psychroaquaticum]
MKLPVFRSVALVYCFYSRSLSGEEKHDQATIATKLRSLKQVFSVVLLILFVYGHIRQIFTYSTFLLSSVQKQ